MSQAPDLPLNTLPLAEPVRGVLRLRLRAAASLPFQQIALDRLNLFLAGGDDVALKLYELILGSGLGVLVAPPARPVPWFEWLGRDAIQPVGFESDQALIPYTGRSFSGYRLLHEYFAFPERFRFVELVGLRRALARHAGGGDRGRHSARRERRPAGPARRTRPASRSTARRPSICFRAAPTAST